MTSIFFSPRGTTKKTARAILGHQEKVLERDLLGRPLTEEWTLPAGEPVLVSMPVYAGRIPGICREMLLAHLKGHGNPAIAVAVYGNRDYDDALVELQDLLEENGFCVIAGAAFVAQVGPMRTTGGAWRSLAPCAGKSSQDSTRTRTPRSI